MKKVIALVLSALMLLSCVACGNQKLLDELKNYVDLQSEADAKGHADVQDDDDARDDDDSRDDADSQDDIDSENDADGQNEVGPTEEDYQDMIDEFVPDRLNTFELEIGEMDKPTAAVWLMSGNGTAYSSDESVVTVSDGGKVTAVGEGSAYVVITISSMYEVYRYDVHGAAAEADLSGLPAIEGVDFAAEIANFVSTSLNTYELKIGDTHSPTAALWAKNGGRCYTSDDSVVTVNTSGTVTAVGNGTAYVLITAGGLFQIYQYIVYG